VVAPLGSIPSVEQFTELVAWPETQSSLPGEDEGPKAQVPQHVEDDSFEATIPEPFVRGMETEETQESTATPERSLEAASEPLAQGEDIPSPQPVADPSTLVLDLSEGQTAPVLIVNTSPPTTPVLHLTDKEDG